MSRPVRSQDRHTTWCDNCGRYYNQQEHLLTDGWYTECIGCGHFEEYNLFAEDSPSDYQGDQYRETQTTAAQGEGPAWQDQMGGRTT